MQTEKEVIKMNKSTKKISEFTGCKYVKIMPRCNSAILCAMDYLKKYGFNEVQIQNDGGWKTYKTIPKLVGLNIVEVETENGVIDVDKLSKIDSKKALLLCEPAGYITSNEKNAKLIRAKTDFLVLDISGSIGKEYIKKFDADIIVCSFGNHKPVGLGYGGFFATNNEKIYSSVKEMFECFRVSDLEKELLEKLDGLYEKYKMYDDVKGKVLNELKKMNVESVSDKNGINIFVNIQNEKDIKKVEDYLKKEKIEFIKCPLYYRLNKEGISVEVKRM